MVEERLIRLCWMGPKCLLMALRRRTEKKSGSGWIDGGRGIRHQREKKRGKCVKCKRKKRGEDRESKKEEEGENRKTVKR